MQNSDSQEKFSENLFNKLTNQIAYDAHINMLLKSIALRYPQKAEKVQQYIDSSGNTTNYSKRKIAYGEVQALAQFAKDIGVEKDCDLWYPLFKNKDHEGDKPGAVSFLKAMKKSGYDVISWIEKYDDIRMYKTFIDLEPERLNIEYLKKVLVENRYRKFSDKHVIKDLFELIKQLPQNEDTLSILKNMHDNAYNTQHKHYIELEMKNYPEQLQSALGIETINSSDKLFMMEKEVYYEKYWGIKVDFIIEKSNNPTHLSYTYANLITQETVRKLHKLNEGRKDFYVSSQFQNTSKEYMDEINEQIVKIVKSIDFDQLCELSKDTLKIKRKIKESEIRQARIVVRAYFESLDTNKIVNHDIEHILANKDSIEHELKMKVNKYFVHQNTQGNIVSGEKKVKQWLKKILTIISNEVSKENDLYGSINENPGEIVYSDRSREAAEKIEKIQTVLEKFVLYADVDTLRSGFNNYTSEKEVDKFLEYFLMSYNVDKTINMQGNNVEAKTVIKKKKI